MKKVLFFLLLFFLQNIFSQGKFQFYGKNDTKLKVKFKRINNLIVFPLEINGKELSFILDTGVNKTILFNLNANDSLGLKSVEKIQLRGLGNLEPVDALLSKNNRFRVGNLINSNEDLYVILKDNFNMSSKMGTTIHGIIGFDILKDVILKIDYSNETLIFYNPRKYRLKKCRRCEEFPLEFFRNKPYINALTQIDTLSKENIKTKLLIDSGGSDAIWLFEGTHTGIKTPKKHFKDVLGEGLNGTIYGNRSRVHKFTLGRFEIPEPTVSFLDTTATINARQFRKRNGSIGGNILKRFKVWLDYPNKRVILKKNGSLKKGFYYNMSGLVVVYAGKDLVKEKVENVSINSYGRENEASSSNSISLVTTYKYQFKAAYKILNVIEGSPAFRAGLLEGDVIKGINGKPSYEYTLDNINSIFSYKPNRKVSIDIERDGVPYRFKFVLEKRI